jgi:phage regulator Rha-like protein
MRSLEIAELVDSRHESVKRAIERCAEKVQSRSHRWWKRLSRE